jgi:hypothetical protein
MNLDQMM